MKKYDNYQDSGVAWLGEVPEHWETFKGKFVFEVINERSKDGSETLLSVSEKHGVIPRKNINVTMFKAASYEGYKLCEKGDLVINSLWAWSNGLGISDYGGIVSTAYGVYRIKNAAHDYNYFRYLLKTQRYVDQYNNHSKGIWKSRLLLSDWSFLEIPMLLPPKPEQTIIARFLDYKCAQIDRFVRQKRRLINLLEEKKQAIINRAVTRGLDETVVMKDSGVEWLGEVPGHWEVRKLKYALSRVSGGITPSMNNLAYWKGGNMLWVTPKDMKFKKIDKSKLKITELALRETSISTIPIGSILMVVRSGILKRKLPTAINVVPITINQDLKAITPNIEIVSANYLDLLFNGIEKHILTHCTKLVATVDSIEMPDLLNFSIPFPSTKEEQNLILRFVKKELTEINTTITNLRREIELIEEYQQALIAEAVTGRIDVRGWEKPNDG